MEIDLNGNRSLMLYRDLFPLCTVHGSKKGRARMLLLSSKTEIEGEIGRLSMLFSLAC